MSDLTFLYRTTLDLEWRWGFPSINTLICIKHEIRKYSLTSCLRALKSIGSWLDSRRHRMGMPFTSLFFIFPSIQRVVLCIVYNRNLWNNASVGLLSLDSSFEKTIGGLRVVYVIELHIRGRICSGRTFHSVEWSNNLFEIAVITNQPFLLLLSSVSRPVALAVWDAWSFEFEMGVIHLERASSCDLISVS